MNTADGVEYWLSLPLAELLGWQEICYDMIQEATRKGEEEDGGK